MKPGKPFNPDYPDMFLKTVKEEGLFDNLGKTKADVKINEQDHTADVTLTFGGGPQQPTGRGRGGRGTRGRSVGLEIMFTTEPQRHGESKTSKANLELTEVRSHGE
jgi:hypothetical protein